MNNGYDFYFQDGSDLLTFPITPPSLRIQVGSNNKVVNLINEGDINILKSPSLAEFEFTARFPMRKYPYSRDVEDFTTYYDFFKTLKEEKKSFRFIVARHKPNGSRTWDTNMLVSLEDFDINEDADEGDDVLVTFKLKQYKEYGITKITVKGDSGKPAVTKNPTRGTDGKGGKTQSYVVKSGDCLWNIAKKFYGDGSTWKKIYNANKSAIEADAKKHGYKSSSNGHWIFPGLKLTIPAK